MKYRTQTLVLLISFLGGCLGLFDPLGPASLINLNASFVKGAIGANLMPPTPPDPIDAWIDVRVENTLLVDNLTDISTSVADVYSTQTRQKLGSIPLRTHWDGFLAPLEVDTIHLLKLRSNTTLFQAPCSQYVYLEFTFSNRATETRRVTTDSLLFTCTF